MKVNEGGCLERNMKIGYFKKYPRHVYGVTYEKRHEVGKIKPRWIITFYFHKWFRLFTNYPLPGNPF